MMKQGTLVRSAFAAVFTFAISNAAFAGDTDKASPQLSKRGGAVSSSYAACKDASGNPVTDVSVCASGGCTDASGMKVADASTCDVKSPRDAASGLATGKRTHKPMSPSP